MGRHKPSYACVNHSDASMISVPVKYYACLFFFFTLSCCHFSLHILYFAFTFPVCSRDAKGSSQHASLQNPLQIKSEFSKPSLRLVS